MCGVWVCVLVCVYFQKQRKDRSQTNIVSYTLGLNVDVII